MFGPRITTVFASRWKALWWSAGILMTAYCTVPSAERAQHDEDKAAAAVAAHKSPWAKDS
jgi:hypothetical protein